MIVQTVIAGKTAFETTWRGVRYITYESLGGFVVVTNRLALGRTNPGGCKRFNSIQEVAESVKAFSGLDRLA